MKVQDYLWYPYLRYQEECKKSGKMDSIQEWLELTGKVMRWKPPAKSKAKAKTKSVSKSKKSNPLGAVLETASKNIKKVRARNSKGHYIADDPNTSENEAWVDVSALKPKRKRGRPKKQKS